MIKRVEGNYGTYKRNKKGDKKKYSYSKLAINLPCQTERSTGTITTITTSAFAQKWTKCNFKRTWVETRMKFDVTRMRPKSRIICSWAMKTQGRHGEQI